LNHWLPTIRVNKTKILAELQQENQRETCRQKVFTILEENPDIQRATYADTKCNPHNVILTIAIRHFATYEMLISKAKYDPFQLLALIETHEQETH